MNQSAAYLRNLREVLAGADPEGATQFLKSHPDVLVVKDFFDGGKTLLHKGVDAGDRPVVAFLLANGADVDAQDDEGTTPLHYAAKKNSKELAELLLASNALVDSRDKNGYTPLHVTAKKGCTDVARLLLASNADVNAKEKDDRTPLYVAVQNSHKELTELLLANKADVSVRTVFGRSPFWAASKKPQFEALLVAHGADPYADRAAARDERDTFLRSERDEAVKTMWTHGALFLVGTGVTAAGVLWMNVGGYFIVFWGAILYGGLGFVRGLFRLLTTQRPSARRTHNTLF